LQGRTGTMISAYIVYKRIVSTAEQAIELFHSRRMLPGVRVWAQCRIFRICVAY